MAPPLSLKNSISSVAAAPQPLADAIKKPAEPISEFAVAASAQKQAAVMRFCSFITGFDDGEQPGINRFLWPLPPALHQPLRDCVADTIRDISARKNVAVLPELEASLMNAIIHCLDRETLCGIPDAAPQPIALMVGLIDHVLDVIAGMRLIEGLWQVEGFEEITPFAFWPFAEKWAGDRAANDDGRNRYWWPDTVATIHEYYRSRAADRLSVRYPDSQPVRATWCLDRAALDGTVQASARAVPKGFLVPRMGNCPCLPGTYLPDGKMVVDYPGERITIWYRNGLVHRNPEEGPAYHAERPDGAFCKYMVNGELHRDHREGPALFGTNIDGSGTYSEEYFQHGQRHRPSSEGPAVSRSDQDGNRVQESYYQNGLCHRDPAAGPAWFGLEDGKSIEAYVVNGLRHRPESEGPAVIARDPATGNVTLEQFFSNGEWHRAHGPAYIAYAEDGTICLESWYRHGKQHRNPLHGPAETSTDSRNGERHEKYYVDGLSHRDPAHGPAHIVLDANGSRIRETYWINGSLHRDPTEGPGITSIGNGFESQTYVRNGRMHREDGPAYICRKLSTGEIVTQEYWFDGVRLNAPATRDESGK